MNTAIIISIVGVVLTMFGQAAGICYFAYKWGVWTGTFSAQMDSVRKDIELMRDEVKELRRNG